MESLNRWEKTISLYRTASGEDISDGILAATVLEHSPESYQNILKQAPSNVRASYSAMRGWPREYAGVLQFNHSRLVWYPWRSIRHEQCRVSRLEKTGRANPKEGARARMVRARAKERKGYCGYCETWGHKRADCRKRIADGESKGGAAAASADNDGDVAAVMDDVDFALDAEGDETSAGWCFGVSSMCAVLGSTGHSFWTADATDTCAHRCSLT